MKPNNKSMAEAARILTLTQTELACELDETIEEMHSQITVLRAALAEKDTVPRSRYDVACDQYNEAERLRKEQFVKAQEAYIRAEAAEKEAQELMDALIELGDYFNGIGDQYEWLHPTEPSFFTWLSDLIGVHKRRFDRPHCVACTHSGPCVGQCAPCRIGGKTA